MSLPTPPKTSHRGEKESRFDAAAARSVSWSATHEYRGIFALDGLKIPGRTAARLPPARSILKKRKHAEMLDVGEPAAQREATPEPADPLMDLEYIARCVGTVLQQESTLRDLIEAYNVLAARLRSSTPMDTDTETTWPLFQPIRADPQAFTDAIVRDLNKARIDPTAFEEKTASVLPSPKKSPTKKAAGGLSAEQVKYARDFSMVCHAVIKLLCFMFTVPATMYLFSTAQLGQMLTAVLAIPLCKELPTLNARKTCALAIALIQIQRLPADVLSPAADRIAYALRRGIEGQLGKEGKKGATSDGLKAVHDLATYQPDIFIPAFSTILPCILDVLVGPSLNFRVLACHALGGLAYGTSQVQRDHVHTHLSDTMMSYLTKKPPASPHKTSASPTTPPIQESPLEKAIRTTLRAANDVVHIGQSPIWALCTLASVIVLLGPAVFTDSKMYNVVTSKIAMACQVKKSSVRVLTMVVVRALIWAAFQPPFLPHPDDEEDEGLAEHALSTEDDEKRWKTVARYAAACGPAAIGQALCASLLGQEDTTDQDVHRVLDVLEAIAKKPHLAQDCIDLLERVLDCGAPIESIKQWDPTALLSEDLFCAYPGLLTADYDDLKRPVEMVCTQAPRTSDIQPLARDQVLQPWVLLAAEGIWMESLKHAKVEGSEVPKKHLNVWTLMLKVRISECEESGDESELAAIASHFTEILINVVAAADINIMTKKTKGNPRLVPMVFKLRLIADLWLVLCENITREHLAADASRLLKAVIDSEEELCESDFSRQAWATLCARLLSVCDSEDSRDFWCLSSRRMSWSWDDAVRKMVWREVVDQWRQDGEASWDGDIVLLAAPFTDVMAMDLESEDLETWEEFLEHAMRRALDDGCESADFLERVASTIFAHFNPTSMYNARAADLLLSRVDLSAEARVPAALLDLVNECLRAAYPPHTQDQAWCTWMLRSLTDVLDKCPGEMMMEVLEALESGLCVWLEDAMGFGEDLTMLYGMILVSVGTLPQELKTLERVAGILEAPLLRPKGGAEPYILLFRDDFWEETYAKMEVPKQGWPPSIQTCLKVCGLTSAEEEEVPEVKEVPATDTLAAPAEIIDVDAEEEELVRPSTPPPRPCTPTSPFVRTVPQTPERDGLPPSSPPGTPAFSVPPTMPTTPQSPLRIPMSPTRTPLSPSKRVPQTPRLSMGSPIARRLVFSSPGKGADQSADKGADEESQDLSAPHDLGVPTSTFYSNPSSVKKRKSKENSRPRKRTLSAPSAADAHSARALNTPARALATAMRAPATMSRLGAALLRDASLSRVALGKRASSSRPRSEASEGASEENQHDQPRPAKRLRRSARLSGARNAEEEKAVQDLLLSAEAEEEEEGPVASKSPSVEAEDEEPVASTSTATPTAVSSPSLVFDAVEVPTLRAVRRRWSGDLKETSTPTRRSMRRTKSQPEPATEEPASKRRRLTPGRPSVQDLKPRLLTHGSKPRTLTRKPTMQDIGFGERLDGLEDPESDDIPSSDSSMPSSDDDPHIGQVTPGHLISPMPSKGSKMLDDDDYEDSDEEDELVDDSPTKGLAARHRRKMMPTNLTPIPFKFSPKV
ncbi:hypothetical protein GGG16DRAFT_93612 [Schizophyllum commune]